MALPTSGHHGQTTQTFSELLNPAHRACERFSPSCAVALVLPVRLMSSGFLRGRNRSVRLPRNLQIIIMAQLNTLNFARLIPDYG
jgi:hypothetical protein